MDSDEQVGKTAFSIVGRSVSKLAVCDDCPFVPYTTSGVILDHPVCGLFRKELTMKTDNDGVPIGMYRDVKCVKAYPWGAFLQVKGKVIDKRYYGRDRQLLETESNARGENGAKSRVGFVLWKQKPVVDEDGYEHYNPFLEKWLLGYIDSTGLMRLGFCWNSRVVTPSFYDNKSYGTLSAVHEEELTERQMDLLKILKREAVEEGYTWKVE